MTNIGTIIEAISSTIRGTKGNKIIIKENNETS